MSVLSIEDVSLSIAGQALFAPISLTISPGTVASVVGPSGSGKSSLLAYLTGTLPADFEARGEVRVGGAELTGLTPEKRRLGILFQDPLLFPHLSVRGNLLFGLRTRAPQATRRRLVDDALGSMGLDGYGERDPATLSGGQKARVALLRVMLAKPRALLLDEPFSALDDDTRGRIRQQVFDEISRSRLPALLVTHDAGDVASAGGPVITLRPTVAG